LLGLRFPGGGQAPWNSGLVRSHPDKSNDLRQSATSLNNLAGLYLTQGNYAHAEPLYQRALAIREKALGPDQPQRGHSS